MNYTTALSGLYAITDNVLSENPTAAYEDKYFREPSWIQQLIMWLVPIMIIVLNIMVLVVIPLVKQLRNSTGAAMVSLAIADFSLGMSSLIDMTFNYTVYDTFYKQIRDPLCKLLAFCTPAFCVASISTLMLINLDRYLTLSYPLRYPIVITLRKIVAIVLSLWSISLILFILPVLGLGSLQINFYEGMYLCLPDYRIFVPYTVGVFTVVLVIPTVIIVYSFTGIFLIARKQNRIIHAHNTTSNPTSTNGFSKKDAQIVKTLLTMTVGFYIMWLPWISTSLIWELVTGHTLHPYVEFFGAYSAIGNSMVNPLIYIPTIKPFRHKLMQLVYNMAGRSTTAHNNLEDSNYSD